MVGGEEGSNRRVELLDVLFQILDIGVGIVDLVFLTAPMCQ